MLECVLVSTGYYKPIPQDGLGAPLWRQWLWWAAKPADWGGRMWIARPM